jgi:hypothetical protein
MRTVIMSFTQQEIDYIRTQRLARVATVGPDGQPDVVPVGFEYDGTHFPDFRRCEAHDRPELGR